MPKRVGNIYSSIYDIDNIKYAHRMARQDKSFYEAVQKTDENLDERAQAISELLKTHTYKVGLYKTSRYTNRGKDRILYKLPYYPDRIIQWAIMLQIEKYFNRVFTHFTCASLPQRGIHYASQLLDSYLQNHPDETTYYLKLDIKKFYPSINRKILKQQLRKLFKDKDLLMELDNIIDSFDKNDIYKLHLSESEKQIYCQPGRGVPVGSYLSQYLANFYLAYFDHWLVEVCGCKYIIRYMDDIVILSDNKDFLHNVLCAIKVYLKEVLDLEIKSNYAIRSTKVGIDIVGYKHFNGYKLLRRKTQIRFKRILKDTLKQWLDIDHKHYCACISIAGWLGWGNSYYFYKKYFYPIIGIVGMYYLLYVKSSKRSFRYHLAIWMKYEKIYKNHHKFKIKQRHLEIHKKNQKKESIFQL